MTKDLYYTIPEYFLARMNEHDQVVSVTDVSTNEFFLFRIDRSRYESLTVWLSDAYSFGDMDYVNRPAELKRGDYILIAKPEGGGGASQHLIDAAGIGVGKLGELMGALRTRDMWTYVAPTWEEKMERKKRWNTRALFGRK
ncbi:hypothetical protein ACLB0R_08630 [Sphingomonas sp. GlSt437]|uniref:hypothetical protein n=1 Tax=Sphingomonas sp. GlSt437 TaxID=3389970 RepID=UPI003A8BE52B